MPCYRIGYRLTTTIVFFAVAGGAKRLQDDGGVIESHRQKHTVLAPGRERAIGHIRRHVPGHVSTGRVYHSTGWRRRQLLRDRCRRSRGECRYETKLIDLSVKNRKTFFKASHSLSQVRTFAYLCAYVSFIDSIRLCTYAYMCVWLEPISVFKYFPPPPQYSTIVTIVFCRCFQLLGKKTKLIIDIYDAVIEMSLKLLVILIFSG